MRTGLELGFLCMATADHHGQMAVVINQSLQLSTCGVGAVDRADRDPQQSGLMLGARDAQGRQRCVRTEIHGAESTFAKGHGGHERGQEVRIATEGAAERNRCGRARLGKIRAQGPQRLQTGIRRLVFDHDSGWIVMPQGADGFHGRR